MTITPINNQSALLGNNEFETGVLTLGAGVTLGEGNALQRVAGKFLPVTDTATQQIVALLPVAATNPGGASADIPIRALVAGKVRKDWVKVNGVAATAAQLDMVRDFGIQPIAVSDRSSLDNQ